MYHATPARVQRNVLRLPRTYAPAPLNAADGGRVAVHASDGQPISRREKASRNVACAQIGARENGRE